MCNAINVYIDALWADNKCTQESIRGAAAMLGLHGLKSWGEMQRLIDYSLAGSELHASVGAGVEALGQKSMEKGMSIDI